MIFVFKRVGKFKLPIKGCTMNATVTPNSPTKAVLLHMKSAKRCLYGLHVTHSVSSIFYEHESYQSLIKRVYSVFEIPRFFQHGFFSGFVSGWVN